MGSTYHGPDSDCYHCSGCGTHRRCDNCSADCCQNNMRYHRDLRSYEDSFANEVNNCPRYTSDHCKSVIKDLRQYYDIIIYYDEYNDYIEQSKHIIGKLETRKDYIIDKSNSIKEDYYVKKRLNDLKENHKNTMDKIRSDYNWKVNNLNSISDSEVENLNREIERKQNVVYELRREKVEIKNQKKSSKEIYKEQQEKIFKEKWEEKKEEIDLKYSYLKNITYPIKEYSQQEKDLKNGLLINIRKIKNYSKIIPNYEFFINSLGLVNYLY